MAATAIAADGVSKDYGRRGQRRRVLDAVSFEVREGTVGWGLTAMLSLTLIGRLASRRANPL